MDALTRILHDGDTLHKHARLALAGLFLATGAFGAIQGGHAGALIGKARTQVSRLADVTGLTVREIRISGQARVSDDAILEALGLEAGGSVFAFDTHAARARLERIAWIRRATIKRLFPASVEVVIEERTPFAIWQRGGQLSVVDETGAVIADVNDPEFAELPLVVGFGAARKAKTFLALIDDRVALKPRIRAAIRVADRRWNLRLINGIDIRLPEENAAAALDRIVALDAEHGLLSRDITAVDLRLPDRLIVRLSGAAVKRRDAAGEAKTGGAAAHDRET